ncbi:MAG: hypothetical protein RLZZ137_1485, partial [Cyanobacteriota bacterium]
MNGAKETRTPDPLHAMQVLYQLSYGPVWIECLPDLGSGSALGPLRFDAESLHRSGPGLAPHRHQAPLNRHLIGVHHDRLVGRVGGLQA